MQHKDEEPQEWSDRDENLFKEYNPLMWRKRDNVFFSSVIQDFQLEIAYIGRDHHGHNNKYYRGVLNYNIDDRVLKYIGLDIRTIVEDTVKEARYHIRQRVGEEGYQNLVERVLE